MIFKNMNPNGFISKLMIKFGKEIPQVMVRFNTIKRTSEEHHCMIKCSNTKTKVLVTFNDEGVRVIGYQRVANTPKNICHNTRQVLNKRYDVSDFDTVAEDIKRLLLTKAEALVESNGKIPGVIYVEDLNEKNVFYSVIHGVNTKREGISFCLSHGFEVDVTVEQMVNIPGITNAVGAYLVMNAEKEIAIMAPAKFESLITP